MALKQGHQDTMKSLPSAFNRTLGFACALIAISQVNFGFDQAVFTNTQAMPNFTRKFGTFDVARNRYAIEPSFLSLLNSLNYIGFAFGLIFGAFCSRKFGRRTSMFVMCGWAIAAAVILVTAQHREQVLAGRIIGYVYIGMELAIVPIFQSEIAPAHVRGFVVGTYQSGLLVCGPSGC
jgi:MFS family permease